MKLGETRLLKCKQNSMTFLRYFNVPYNISQELNDFLVWGYYILSKSYRMEQRIIIFFIFCYAFDRAITWEIYVGAVWLHKGNVNIKGTDMP